MINKKKIGLMCKLAVYEKKYGNQDKMASQYFRYDYISKKNFFNLILVFIFSAICIIIYELNNVYDPITGVDIGIDKIKSILISSAILDCIITGVFGLIGFIVYNIDYSKRIKRIDQFYSQLEEIKEFE